MGGRGGQGGRGASPARAQCSRWRVLFFLPNVIGYVRVGILVAAAASVPHDVAPASPAQPGHASRLHAFVLLYGLSGALDLVDGVVARALGQTSRFGAFLDVVVDVVARAMAWALVGRLSSSSLAVFGAMAVVCTEWLVFVVTHAWGSKQWKDMMARQAGDHDKKGAAAAVPSTPPLVAYVMRDNFKTVVGAWVMLSIFGLPVWLVVSSAVDPPFAWRAATTVALVLGRALGAVCELWVVWSHVCSLTAHDAREHSA